MKWKLRKTNRAPPSPAPCDMAGGLAIRDLRVHGNRGRVLLDIPALSVAPGEMVCVRGPSGAGKSTLLFAIAGLVRGVEGTITWAGHTISDLSSSAAARFRRDQMGLIFQDYLLFEELDPLANASLTAAFRPAPARRAVVTRAAHILDRFGLGDLGRRRVRSFSGGERQRVAVARALAHEPALILADEPTANLDRGGADRLVDDLMALVAGGDKTLLLVSHDAAVQARANRVVTLRDGRLAAPADAAAVGDA